MSNRDQYKPKTPPMGVRAQLAQPPEDDWDDITGQHHDPAERARLRAERASRVGDGERIAHLDARVDAIADQRKERFDRIDRGLENIGKQINTYSERVATAEANGKHTHDAIVALGPKLELILGLSADVKRTADSMQQMVARADVLDRRMSTVETEQRLAATKFEEHDKRDQKMETTLGRIETRVGALETARAVEDGTSKIKRLVARQRPWWFTAKGMTAVLAGIAATTTAIIAALLKGCG